MGVLNIYIAYTFSEDIWVNFKLFGGIGLLIAFVIAQGLWLSRYMDAEQS
jgi:intracellular septation protein